jgi:uroporphyrinogen-III decarboxylase
MVGYMQKIWVPRLLRQRLYAAFDAISDFFRGMKDAMLDMYRRPEKLLEAIEKHTPPLIKSGLAAKQTGCKRVTFAVHKGLDGFMNIDQFKKFFWSGLRKIIIALIENDLTPSIFWEGNVESRLETIADIPKGKAIYAFESTDIFKAKDILGDTVCIQGNVPASLLILGNQEGVKDYYKKLIDYAGKGGGFIMASVTPLDDAKIENVKTLFDFTRDYGV